MALSAVPPHSVLTQLMRGCPSSTVKSFLSMPPSSLQVKRGGSSRTLMWPPDLMGQGGPMWSEGQWGAPAVFCSPYSMPWFWSLTGAPQGHNHSGGGKGKERSSLCCSQLLSKLSSTALVVWDEALWWCVGHAAEEQPLAAHPELLTTVNLCLWLESEGSKWPVQTPIRTRVVLCRVLESTWQMTDKS